MGKEEKGQSVSIIVAFVVFSLVCLCMYNFQGIYSFTLYPDEFGYWASAARILGIDFSETSSIGSFYSFGYSLVLAPIMLLFKDSIIAYRAAVIVNLLLQVASFFVIKKILDRFLEEKDQFLKYLLSGLAVLYPSWVFYTQMTMSEALLFFMYALTALLMMRFIDRPATGCGILLSLSALYMYTVHMRTIGVVAAVFISIFLELFFFGKKTKNMDRKKYILVLVLLALGFVFCLYLKNNVVDALYSSGKMNKVYVNDYSGQTGKLLEILSPMGIGRFLVSMTGKILYLGCATFGCAYVGIYALIKRIQKGDRKALYILLASCMEFMVMCVYLLHSADLDASRYDLFLHGRYFDFAIPLLGIIGFYELIRERDELKKILISLGIVLLTGGAALAVTALNRDGFSDPHGALMIGMSYFLDEDNFRPVAVIVFALLMTVTVAMAMLLLIKFYKRSENAYLLLLAHVLLIVLSYHACSHFIYMSQVYIHGDVMVADMIKELKEEGHEGDVVLLYEGGFEYIDTVQMRLRDELVNVQYVDEGLLTLAEKSADGETPVTERDELSKEEEELQAAIKEMASDKDLVLVDCDSPLKDSLSKMYAKTWEAGHFILYYNEAAER